MLLDHGDGVLGVYTHHSYQIVYFKDVQFILRQSNTLIEPSYKKGAIEEIEYFCFGGDKTSKAIRVITTKSMRTVTFREVVAAYDWDHSHEKLLE